MLTTNKVLATLLHSLHFIQKGFFFFWEKSGKKKERFWMKNYWTAAGGFKLWTLFTGQGFSFYVVKPLIDPKQGTKFV